MYIGDYVGKPGSDYDGTIVAIFHSNGEEYATLRMEKTYRCHDTDGIECLWSHLSLPINDLVVKERKHGLYVNHSTNPYQLEYFINGNVNLSIAVYASEAFGWAGMAKHNKIQAIKLFRMQHSCGLKEAKDCIEWMMSNWQ